MGLFGDGANGTHQEPLLLLSVEESVSVEGIIVDHKVEKEADRSSSSPGGWRAASLIMASDVFERFAFFGIYTNLIVYLSGPLSQSTATAAANVNAWFGAGFMLPLLGAYISNSFLGPYNSILYFTLLYILGLAMMTFSAIKHSSSPPSSLEVMFFFTSLYTVAIAQAGRKPCAQAFAADQFDIQDPSERRSKCSFFDWWYCALSSGMALSLILSYVQENLGWPLVFGIPCVCMLVSLLLFLVGSKTYRYNVKENETSPYSNIAKEIKQDGFSKAGEVISRLGPIWCTCLIHSVIVAQTSTLYTKQGSTMDRSIGSILQIPAASLAIFVHITAIVTLPIYDRVFVPIARALTGRQSGITTLQRMGFGMFLSIIAMMVSSIVETKRLRTAAEHGVDETVPMSVLWLLPQYILCGVSSANTNVGSTQFFYDEVPNESKSMGLALIFTNIGVGSFLSSLLVTAIERATSDGHGRGNWFPKNLNEGHLDYFYWLIFGLDAAGLIAFIYFSKSYSYRNNGGNAVS
ncbi:hypothetical protein Syun_003047 [Stephania yunnanensis]|uniref:Uncharacterized protein n=1 Tax=Stephania yunnanensis TaxID=152371 RepID=A0AAP0Q096_9MAGN